MKYIIKDWAGNDKSNYYGTFDTFEDAWGALYAEFDHLSESEFNETMGEFYVELETSETKPKRYLDPKDIRGQK